GAAGSHAPGHVGGAATCVASGGLAIGPLAPTGAASGGRGIGAVVPIGERDGARGASFQVLRYRYMNTTQIPHSPGPASSAPTRPYACSPRNSEKITSTGWIFAAVPMILGLSRLASMK